MRKILLISGSYPINTRSSRIIKSLQGKNKIEYCAWDRNGKVIQEERNKVYSKNIGNGKKIKKLINLYGFIKFVKDIVKNNKPDIIIASQWDMVLVAILSNFKGKIIYENLDLPTSSNKLILKILLLLEKLMLKKVNGVIYASRFFIPLYSKHNMKELLLENLPLKEISEKKFQIEEREKLRISFIGGLRYFETMKNLLLASQKNKNVEIYLIGKGPENSKFKNFIKKNDLKNIFIIDSYKYEEIKKLYLNTDFVWAVYPNRDYNVKFAISNKFFESVLFEKPCFFAKNTLLGDFVEQNNIGIIVDPYDIEEINDKIEKISKNTILELQENIKRYKKNQKLYWEDNEIELLNFIKEI